MLKFLPLLLLVGYGYVAWKFSAWALRRRLDAQARPLDEPALEAVVRRLGRAVDIPHLRAHVLPDDAFNGLAAPDGRIFITEGALDRFRRGGVSAEEIGSVIAHELGHVALGHTRRRMTEMAAQNAGRFVMISVLGRLIPFVGGWIGAWVAGILTSLVTARLSRRDEYEADAYAAALMKKAGVAAEAQVSLFRKLSRGGPTPAGVAWLMGHPPMEKRIEAVERLHAGWNA